MIQVNRGRISAPTFQIRIFRQSPDFLVKISLQLRTAEFLSLQTLGQHGNRQHRSFSLQKSMHLILIMNLLPMRQQMTGLGLLRIMETHGSKWE